MSGYDLKSTRYSCPILVILGLFRDILEKCYYIKYHANPFNGSRVALCIRTDGRTDGQTDGRTDMTKVIVAFRNLANALTK
jgi:hypothetical protein